MAGGEVWSLCSQTDMGLETDSTTHQSVSVGEELASPTSVFLIHKMGKTLGSEGWRNKAEGAFGRAWHRVGTPSPSATAAIHTVTITALRGQRGLHSNPDSALVDFGSLGCRPEHTAGSGNSVTREDSPRTKHGFREFRLRLEC